VATKKKKAAQSKTAALKRNADEKASVEYRSLTGHNYINDQTGKEVRVDAGGKIEAGTMSPSSITHELRDGKIEEWEPKKTENVVTEDEEEEVSGVTIRHHGDDLEIKEVGD
jgi:hypothetical protein